MSFIRFVILGFLCGSLHAGSVFEGPTLIADQTLENVTIYGPTTFSNAIVKKLATIKGSVDAKNSTLENLYIQGMAKLEGVKAKEIFSSGILFLSRRRVPPPRPPTRHSQSRRLRHRRGPAPAAPQSAVPTR